MNTAHGGCVEIALALLEHGAMVDVRDVSFGGMIVIVVSFWQMAAYTMLVILVYFPDGWLECSALCC